MRIISGTRKGKRLTAPSNLPVRPTTDFAKEALFNILMNHFDIPDCSVLDLFAGTGNISYEFASRGAAFVLAVDNNDSCIKYIIRTAEQLEFHQLKTMKADVLQFIRKSGMSWDIIFADPPFDFPLTSEIPDTILKNKLLRQNGILIIEHPPSISFSDHEKHIDFRKYGSVCFSFFSENSENSD